jgi:hypothetical protein
MTIVAIHKSFLLNHSGLIPQTADLNLVVLSLRSHDGVDGARTGISLNEELCQDGCR